MNTELKQSSKSDFKKIICRRVPIKLQQFARLLTDLTESEVDPVRIKAMESQIRKTKDTCIEYDVESTANLLAKIESQLNLDPETIDSQKPLIKRFVQRLESHADRLKLGQITTGTEQAVKAAKKTFPETDSNSEAHQQTQTTDVAAEQSTHQHAELTDTTAETESKNAQPEEPTAAAAPTEVTSVPGGDRHSQIEPQYEFKHSVVEDKSETPKLLSGESELTIYWCLNDDSAYPNLKQQMSDFGYNVEPYELTQAIAAAAGNSQKVVLAQLEDFDDEVPEPVNEISHFIVLAQHDNLEQRLKSIRLGATLFFAEPIDTIKIMEYLDNLERTTNDSPFRIAVMEDSKAQAKYNDKVLSDAGFETCIVIEPMELLNALSNFDAEVIFMDMQMPGCNGIELTKVLRQQERFQTVPIVFLSAEENHEKQREAMTSGGTAFIEKPVKKEQLLFTAELYARRTRNLQPHLARDFQTGLNSPALLKEQVTIEAERAMRQNNSMFFALIEMNGLAELNQNHGYAFGERAMQQLARLLRQRLRKTDCVGFFDSHRIGVILSHCADDEAEKVMSYLTQSFASSPVAFEGKNIRASLSVGLSRLGSDYDVQRLVKRAEAALNQAAQSGDTHLIWAHESK